VPPSAGVDVVSNQYKVIVTPRECRPSSGLENSLNHTLEKLNTQLQEVCDELYKPSSVEKQNSLKAKHGHTKRIFSYLFYKKPIAYLSGTTIANILRIYYEHKKKSRVAGYGLYNGGSGSNAGMCRNIPGQK
jgi:hypothetical protein